MRKRCSWKFMMCGTFLLIFISMWGCGKSDSVTAPSGSTISLSESSISWDVTSPPGCPSFDYNDHTITITVKDSAGQNMNGADIIVELALSPNSGSPSVQVLQMFDGDTGLPVTSPYHTETGDHGTKNMIVRVDFGCTYKANFNVFSGDAFASASIEVSGS